MKPRVSILAPCRGRPELVKRMADSARATAGDPGGIEIVLRVDVDDEVMLHWMRAEVWHEPAVIGPHRSGYASLPSFINEAARLATADLLIVVNDDAEFLTQKWDDKIVAAALRFPDGLFNFGIETANADNFIFPCVSRTLIDALGCVYDERLIYPDIWLRDVLMPFGRAVRLRDVAVAHHWQGQTPDQAQAATTVHTMEYARLYAQCVEEGRAKVRAVLPC